MSNYNHENTSEESSLLLNDEEDFFLSKDSPQDIKSQQIRNPHPHDQQSNSEEQEPEKKQFFQQTQRSQSILLLKIGKMMHELVRYKEKTNVYEEYCSRLRAKVEQKQAEIQGMKSKLSEKEKQIEKNREQLQQQVEELRDSNSQFKIKVQQLEVITLKKEQTIKELDKKLKEKEEKNKSLEEEKLKAPPFIQNPELMKLKKKIKEMSKINRILEEQLRIANRKLIQMEKDYQTSKCEMALGNIYRLKESTSRSIQLSNQQNSIRAPGNRGNGEHCFEKSVPMKGYLHCGGIGGVNTDLLSFLKDKNKSTLEVDYSRARALSTKNY